MYRFTSVDYREVGRWHQRSGHDHHGHLLTFVSNLPQDHASFDNLRTSVATTSPTTATVTTATAASVSDHFLEFGVNLLLSFLQNVYQVTGLLGVCNFVSKRRK